MRAGYALRVAYRRGHNRVVDVIGRAAGFCMADCWQDGVKGWSPGFPHWRCWVLRKDHSGPWHRSGSYRWKSGQAPMFDPLPVAGFLRSGPVRGRAPRWLSGRHYMVARRRLEREHQRYVFELMRAAASPSRLVLSPAAKLLAESGMSADELSTSARLWIIGRKFGGPGMPLHSDLSADRHDYHLHRPKTQDESEATE